MKIYLIRHGETDFNRRGIVQGGGVDSDLNALGREQSDAFFQHYRHIEFDAVYVSPLKRTHQTVQRWQDERGFQLQIEPGLTELSWGVLEGKVPTREESEAFRQLKQKWQAGQLELSVEGGESPLQCWERLQGVLQSLKQKHLNQTILVCSHGRTSRVLLASITGNGLTDMERFNHSNTGLNILQLDESGAFRAEVINSLAHLKATRNAKLPNASSLNGKVDEE